MPYSLEFGLELSARAVDLFTSSGNRRQLNAFAREAMDIELVRHHTLRIPGHFQTTARAKYGYKERSKAYKAVKYREGKGRTDLVNTGKTRVNVTGFMRRTVTGSWQGRGGGLLVGRLRYRLGFPYSRKNPKSSGVSPDDIRAEIARITDQEATEISLAFRAGLLQRINNRYSQVMSRRARTRL